MLSDEQMSKRWQFSLLNDEQMSNWVGVEHLPEAPGLVYLDVSKNRGVYPPKWMVYFMEKPIKMDDLGVPLFLETPILLNSDSVLINYQLSL